MLGNYVLDLRECAEGMSCEDYSLLAIAGPYSKDLPPLVRGRMQEHENACSYHQSKEWHQSAAGTPVTETMEQAAMELVDKYNHEV